MRHAALCLVSCALAACPEPPAGPPVADDTVVALDDALVRRVLAQRCVAPLDSVTAVNPSLDDDAWASRLLGTETTAVRSAHVTLDDEAVAACTAALDGDDCGVVEERCLPFSRFFLGSLEDGATCGVAHECRGVCVFASADCGVCATCASSFDCGDGEVCVDGDCAAPRANGETCVGADQCESGLLCADGRCVPKRDTGERCDEGLCTAGLVCGPTTTCQAPGADGSACVDDGHCASGRCVDDVCAALPTTGACHRGRCGAGARCDDDLCGAVAVGDACTNGGDCGSAAACVAGVCQPRRGPGEVCTASAVDECPEGFGCFINETGGPFRCRSFSPRVAIDERCEAALCSSGTCTADRDGIERCIDATFGTQVGDACTPAARATCAYPLVCAAATGTCQAPTVVGPGEACDDVERVCRDELLGARCDDGVCVARGGEGAACGVDGRRRDGRIDDGCDATTTVCGVDGLCVRADEGAACEFSCLAGLHCGDDGICGAPGPDASRCTE